MITAFLALPFITLLSKFATAALQIVTPLLVAVGDLAIWFAKQFFIGLKAIFDNLSVLAVIAVVIVGSGWYFKTWDNDKVLKKCQETCLVPKEPVKKYIHPIKRRLPTVVYTQPVLKKQEKIVPKKSFNPFEGN